MFGGIIAPMKNGFWYGFGAYVLWGILPVFWKLLDAVPAFELIGYRICASFLLLILFITFTGQGKTLRAQLKDRKIVRIYLLEAVLLGVNWMVYLWAVQAGFIVETSLGYFINPLVNVLLGVLVLKERLRPWQWLPIGLAAAGVFYLTFGYGELPWIALTLAFSFGFYGLVKKNAPLTSLQGLTMETGLMLLPALGYVVFTQVQNQGVVLDTGLGVQLLVLGAGLVTIVPLAMFAVAAQRIPLSILGMLQYIAPTLQFLLGVFIYKEAFNSDKLIGYGIVWLGLAFFILEGWLHRRSARALAVSKST